MVAPMPQHVMHKSVHHIIEQLSFLCKIDIVTIHSFPIYAGSASEIETENTSFATDLCQYLRDGFALFVGNNHHTRLQSWRLFQHTEQVATVKEIAFAERRQVFAACYNLGSHL